jgi:hypothetical protein
MLNCIRCAYDTVRARLLFERWYRSEVKAVAGPQHAQALRQFTTWRLLPRMRTRPQTSS